MGFKSQVCLYELRQVIQSPAASAASSLKWDQHLLHRQNRGSDEVIWEEVVRDLLISGSDRGILKVPHLSELLLPRTGMSPSEDLAYTLTGRVWRQKSKGFGPRRVKGIVGPALPPVLRTPKRGWPLLPPGLGHPGVLRCRGAWGLKGAGCSWHLELGTPRQ